MLLEKDLRNDFTAVDVRRFVRGIQPTGDVLLYY